MNEMKATEVRAMTVEQLNEKLDSLKKDLFFLRMQHATNQDVYKRQHQEHRQDPPHQAR